MVGGFDVDSEPGFLESEAVGIIFKVLFFSLKLAQCSPTAHFANLHMENYQSCLWERTRTESHVLQVGFVAFVSAGVAAILLLARPVIDNTIKAFPYRSIEDGQQGGAPDVKSLIPGLDSGDSQGSEDSIF